QNRPAYGRNQLTSDVDPAIAADLRTVFGHFAAAAKAHSVPVTLLLLPNYEQVMQTHGLAIQETYAAIGRDLGWDVCDACDAFRNYPDKPALFIPDKHFSRTGNRLLLSALIAHLKAVDPASA